MPGTNESGLPRQLKIGLVLPTPAAQVMQTTGRAGWPDLRAMAIRAEALGFASIWLADHLIYRFDGIPDDGPWECWSVLSALAAVTERVELGTLVACTGFRNPALLAKMAGAVDEISGGRLTLGLGAGWHEPEYRAFGFPFDHRIGRFAEAITIIHDLLREGRADFAGRYFEIRDCELRPRGPRAGGPPILVGGSGPRLLRLAAAYADAWNGMLLVRNSHAGAIPPLRDRVDAACHDIGRDPATLARSASVRVRLDVDPGRDDDNDALSGSPEALVEEFRAFAREGITHLQVLLEPNTLASIEAFAPTLALLHEMSADPGGRS